MEAVKIAIGLVFICGLLGAVLRFTIAAFPGQTLRSKYVVARIASKLSIFCLHYMISFMLTAIPLSWVMELFEIPPGKAEIAGWLYLIACIPIAALLYWADTSVVAAIYRRSSNSWPG